MMNCVSEQIYFCANDGMSLTVLALLERINREEIISLLHQEYIGDSGERCCPLIISSMKGHEKMVTILCNKYHVNLEQAGSVKVDSTLVEGATALWIAAANGELGVVKILVKAGANVNHTTTTQSTPVRAACYHGRLDIVTYLVEHGADLSITNKFNSSCLMIAAYKGYVDIVKYLLSKNMDINQVAHCGSSALHFAAECGHLVIVKELLKNNAKSFPNSHGMTPVLCAAERTRIEVVNYLIKCDGISKRQKIDALELLGASFANDKENYSIQACYDILLQAMLLRYVDPDDIILKQKDAGVACAYGQRVECQTVEELESIKDDVDSLHMESLIIRERILGCYNPDVSHSVVFRGAVYADNMRFENCIQLWLHAIYLQQLNSLPITKDLLRFSQVFSQMYCCQIAINPCYFLIVLKAAFYEIRKLNEKIAKRQNKNEADVWMDEMEGTLIHTLYIIVIITKINSPIPLDMQYQIERTIHRILTIGATTRNGYSLLHLCVDGDTPVDSFHTDDVCQFPCSLTASLFIRLGADVNARDNHRNTPLHIIVGYNKPISDFMTLHTIITRLVEGGAHTDAVNCFGKTPNEAATTGVADVVLKHLSTFSLKCMAAKVVQKHDIAYVGIVPKHLESFVEMHGKGTYDVSKDDETTANNATYYEISHSRTRWMLSL